ncbi:hypothetical protein PR048_013830 [Dryococelus australis]|uniref:Uncharacterized protein n=1 Tax=Dryococelus australis TaxID=614101 RepID=A0ABQ9HTA1_9NEOP|nr:hypothetical protein PR048_013830 [Dryococelus australis]
MAITMKKDIFLSNKENKQSFIIYMCNKLEAVGCTTKQADADVTIVTEGVASAQKYPTAIIGEDTDLFILLIHYVNIQCCDIFIFPEPKKSSRYVTVYDIKQIRQRLGEEVCSHILFAHALLGCETTSKPCGFGKTDTIKLLKKNDIFKKNAAVFKSGGKSKEEIQAAGHAAMVSVHWIHWGNAG